MSVLRAWRALGPMDGISVGRDPLLRWLLGVPLGTALVVRWLGPPLVARAGELLQVDLAAGWPTVIGYALLLLTPNLAGMVVGFLLLDQRDDGTLTALRVTPLPLRAYVAYRLAAPAAASLLLGVVVFPLAGMAALGPLPLLAVVAGTAPLAPLFALFLATFAANKVQGFALTKLSGVLLAAPLAHLFAPAEWSWLAGVVPTYWPARAYWALAAGEPGAWAFLAVGLAYQGALLVLLLRRFSRILSR